MEMTVEITSKEIMKPSSPTPHHLRTHKLTIIDQLSINLHVPLLLFYPPPPDHSQNPTKTTISDLLKKSLQVTLTHFYPLSGRLKNNSYVDCNDKGAIFVEAQVSCDMSVILNDPHIDQLRKLLPCDPNQNLLVGRFSVPEILLVQVNYFSCGGMAISLCVNHQIADASTIGTFVRSWGAIARGVMDRVDGVIFDGTALFPPMHTFGLTMNDFVDKDVMLRNNHVVKRFMFKGSKIAALREKIGSLGPDNTPTRFEAVSALIWGAGMAATHGKEGKTKAKDHVALTVVNLRKRMNPPLPQESMGNIWKLITVSCSAQLAKNYNNLAGKLHESVREVNDEYIRRFYKSGGLLCFMKFVGENLGNKRAVDRMICFSSWCKLPFYEADFGWGKPIWVATAMGINKVAIFLDTRDGEGIEVWLGLPLQQMAHFELNPDIIQFASFSRSSSPHQ